MNHSWNHDPFQGGGPVPHRPKKQRRPIGSPVGRTLLNYWLMSNNYPPAIVYEENRRAYYDALQAYDEQEDLTPLVQFLEAQTVKTWSRNMDSKNPTPHKKLNSFLL